MGETRTFCSECGCEFSTDEHSLTKGYGKIGGIGFGGALGSKFGVAGGILGFSIAYIAIIPAALFGLSIGLFFDSILVRCPDCDKFQLS